MTRFRTNSSSIGSFFLVFVLILFFTLFLGQGLGRFYLGNITRELSAENLQRKVISSRESNLSRELSPKMKVLRLKQVDYYTILVATLKEQDIALQVGNELGQKGLPVIVTGEGPYQILLGFVNNQETLIDLAKKIKVGAKEAEVKKDCLNKVAFKFTAEDTYAAEKIAPFLGEISLCLEKGLLLYQSIGVKEEKLVPLKPKFFELADSLDNIAKEGLEICKGNNDETGRLLGFLAELCSEWAQSLRLVGKEWTDLALLKSQQQGLVLLEEYHRYIKTTN
ncbi:MAG: hypothetical protein GX092_01365 [Clostridia bacterium]|nr:hypothetical protein [Clostridia bacterium]